MKATTAVIRKDGPASKPYCVYSEKTGRNFGCYSTREGAEKRLKQIEVFKHIKGEICKLKHSGKLEEMGREAGEKLAKAIKNRKIEQQRPLSKRKY